MKQMTRGLEDTHLSDVQIYLKEHAKDWAIQYVRDAIREQEKLIYINMSRQGVAFLEECRKIKGCVSLREDFYTKFMTGN